MADNYPRIRAELLAGRFTLEQSSEGRCGVYAFVIEDVSALAQLVAPRLPDFGDGLLYVGMTSPGKGSTARDHVECNHSGGSTLRRSLGALLKDRLQPRLSAMRRAPGDSPQNWRCYRFQDEGEAALTRWMKANLRTNFVSLGGEWETVRACERKLIEELRPPLNLTDWDNPQRRMIKSLRAQCAGEARSGPGR